MINRKAANYISDLYENHFTYLQRSFGGSSSVSLHVERDKLYDFLYENEYEPWFQNLSKTLLKKRDIKELIMKLHTGETAYNATPNWEWPARKLLGQTLLEKLIEDFLNHLEKFRKKGGQHFENILVNLNNELKIAGYVFDGKNLRKPEMDAADIQETVGVLEGLYIELDLENKEIAFRNLKLSEEFFFSEKWEDCISNSRKFLECCLTGVAKKYNQLNFNKPLGENIADRPVLIREYLEKNNLLESREKNALDKVYGLLSHTGSHPYMAKDDQARLLRNLALTFSQFTLLRFKGFLAL